jgi:hypothetical protein
MMDFFNCLFVVYVKQGMKVSCTHFQCSAWAFQHLRDSFETNASPDMNYQLLSFKSYLMLVRVAVSSVFALNYVAVCGV